MKKTILFTITLAFCAGMAVAHCGNCPGDKKAEVKQSAPADAAKPAVGGKKCGDCPKHKEGVKCDCGGHGKDGKKAEGKKCAHGKDGDKAEGKKCGCGKDHKDGKACDKAAHKYTCAACKVESDKPGKCAKCGAELTKAPCEHGKAKEAGAKKDGKVQSYMCAMKCAKFEKPGKCPKCGMPMEKVN